MCVFVVTVAGYTLVTFATGGIGDWFAEFLHRVRGMELEKATLAIGASAIVGGDLTGIWIYIVGPILGGLIGWGVFKFLTPDADAA